MLSPSPTPTRPRRRSSDRRSARSRVPAASRDRIAAALARRGARERLVLTLLLYERLFPVEVADALRLSLRQVERTYDALIAELHRPATRAGRRSRTRAGAVASRVRKAA
jgi:DNA-directed RNA polymerase specialized sigma24 family protein